MSFHYSTPSYRMRTVATDHHTLSHINSLSKQRCELPPEVRGFKFPVPSGQIRAMYVCAGNILNSHVQGYKLLSSRIRIFLPKLTGLWESDELLGQVCLCRLTHLGRHCIKPAESTTKRKDSCHQQSPYR